MSENHSRATIQCDHCRLDIIKHNLKVYTKRQHPGSVVKERIKRQLPVGGFFTSKKAKIYDIFPDIEQTSNDESILQNTTNDDFTLEEKTKYIVVFGNSYLNLSDFKDIMNKNTKKIIDNNARTIDNNC